MDMLVEEFSKWINALKDNLDEQKQAAMQEIDEVVSKVRSTDVLDHIINTG